MRIDLAQILDLLAKEGWRRVMRVNPKCAHHWEESSAVGTLRDGIG